MLKDKVDVAGGAAGISVIADDIVKFVDVRFIYFNIIVNVALCALSTTISGKKLSFIHRKNNHILPSMIISFGIDCSSMYSFTFL
jgi:hypothetical protein